MARMGERGAGATGGATGCAGRMGFGGKGCMVDMLCQKRIVFMAGQAAFCAQNIQQVRVVVRIGGSGEQMWHPGN